MSTFDNLKKKATEAVDKHGDKIGKGIDRAKDEINKRTGGKHADTLDQGAEKVKEGLDGLDGVQDDITTRGDDASRHTVRDAERAKEESANRSPDA